jgi:NADH-quinone oxidoreductase subunit H
VILALLQSTYTYQEAESVWEALRVWLNAEPIPGFRFTASSSNIIMLVAALLFIFMLELLLTIGIQLWERRVLARTQSRWGPQQYGSVTPASFRRVAIPIVILLAVPALLYGVQYWSQADLEPFPTFGLLLLIGLPLLLGGAARAIFGRRRSQGLLHTLSALALLVWGVVTALIAIAIATGPVDFGDVVPLITVACTVLAFLIYIVYTLGWAWRQGLMDAVKLFFKEDVTPINADRFLFLAAPVLVYIPALLSWVVIPFGVMTINGKYVYLIVQDLNVGMLLIIADFAMFLVAIIMSGYGSNNKYALIGAMREAAMLLTYEIPMLMSLLCVALFAGSLNLTTIVEKQTMTWGVLPLFPAFVIYLIAALAETNRPPFDLAEASNELLGGYLVEYSGIRFALFYIAEYANVFTASALMTVCFFGGWKGPMFLGFDGLWLTSVFWFLLKTYAGVFFFIWARATMPRIRVDQIMFFSWKFLLPVSVGVLALTAVGVAHRHPWYSANEIWDPVAFVYRNLSTAEALAQLTLRERAFFWTFNAGLLAAGLFVLWLAWKVLVTRTEHPRPRRAITWA